MEKKDCEREGEKEKLDFSWRKDKGGRETERETRKVLTGANIK